MWRVPHLFFKDATGNRLIWLASTAAGCGFVLFGYDQGVMGGLISLERFLEVFPECRDPDVAGITVAVYELGCLLGAIWTIAMGDRLGRKNTIMLGMIVMCIGAAIMSASFGLAEFLNTATIPSLQSELAPPRIRGALVLISGALVATGIAISYAIEERMRSLGFFFLDGSVSWRAPLAFQIIFAIMVMVFLLMIPESPAWLVKHSDRHPDFRREGRETLARIYEADAHSEHINGLVDAMDSAAAQVANSRFKDIFTHGPTQNFRRASLGFVAQILQQITGINLISYYSATLFEQIGLSPLLSRYLALANGIEYALAAFASIMFVDTLGRRKTMIWGSIGCGICMMILTGLVHASDNGQKACGYAATVFLFVFNTSFAFGWLGSGWLYPSEISTLAVRAQANGLSTCANWLGNFLVVEITPPAFAGIGAYTYLIFAVTNLCIITPILYFFFPETARRSLEEIDLIFAEAYNEQQEKGGNRLLGHYVGHSIRRPHISGRELETVLQAQYALARGKMPVDLKAFSIEHVEEASTPSSKEEA
ncbi:general substrate transporter [Rhodotorula sp. JG-1b]|nr:general substrate transporter [Rhodotorula sp. JG-1b]